MEKTHLKHMYNCNKLKFEEASEQNQMRYERYKDRTRGRYLVRPDSDKRSKLQREREIIEQTALIFQP